MEHFDLQDDILYLNHAAVSPWPRRTVEAVQRFAAENGTTGSRRYMRWLATETRLRERLAALIGAAAATDIALTKSTSEALSMVAQGLPWQTGDTVVGIVQEFPSNRIVWEALADRGVRWRGLDLYDLRPGENPEDALLALCDARTRLLAVSWVQYARGLRLDLERLGAACRARGILFCIDGIQGLGALPFDVERVQADFVAADGHKWMLGPEGLALFWCRPELREQIRLSQFGWHMVQDMGDFERKDWQPAADARRFESGSPNLLGAHALEASLSLLQEVGMQAVADAIAERTDRLIALIDQHGLELLSPRAPDRRAGIVTFRVPGIDQQALYQALMTQGLMCASRGGGLRFSPHFYTRTEQLERAIALTLETATGLMA
ncbi:aminotransferase class V-fold PLP-dependent enzyme [Thiohalocapsa marina]|uniref:Aminotransferase class V-fold PLP-dependent enzyme n=1 Tax=Thiohalocapsa marina TaxID=424902 RepID=A0A5M8FNL3_9GAMM|nr:aminotransferase class V-fold PLP-dependent enzyme [Thiohalocapsa marina]